MLRGQIYWNCWPFFHLTNSIYNFFFDPKMNSHDPTSRLDLFPAYDLNVTILLTTVTSKNNTHFSITVLHRIAS